MATLAQSTSQFEAVAPVSIGERINSVDILRGFSLLGILLMNVVDFGLPHNAYDDPTAAGGATGLNLLAWTINYLLFEGKMRAIFSMLFGAGVIIFTSRAESRGAGIEVADIYYRRTLWLMVIGTLHAYFIWIGDILFAYALCGLMLFPLRKLAPRTLIFAGVLLLAVLVPKHIAQGRELQHLRDDAAKADSAARSGAVLTPEQKAAQEKWTERLKNLKPDKQAVEKEIRERKSYRTWFFIRAGVVARIDSIWFYQAGFFDVAGMMLLGMGLMKAGVFSALRSKRFYVLLALAGYGVGFSVNAFAAHRLIATQFDVVTTPFIQTTYDLGRMSVALGHVALIMLVCKAGLFRFLTAALASVGQMALSCYLSTSLLCMIFFERLNMFGELQRFQLYYIVLAVWVILIVFAGVWLQHFRFGPMEWVWRSLTYWKKQPMRLPSSPLASAATAP